LNPPFVLLSISTVADLNKPGATFFALLLKNGEIV